MVGVRWLFTRVLEGLLGDGGLVDVEFTYHAMVCSFRVVCWMISSEWWLMGEWEWLESVIVFWKCGGVLWFF